MEPKTVTIDGKEITVTLFGAEEGWRLVHKLTRILGPAVSFFATDDWARGLESLFKELPEAEIFPLLKQLTSVVLVDGKKFGPADLQKYLFTIEVCAAVIQENFADFFYKVRETMFAIKPETAESS